MNSEREKGRLLQLHRTALQAHLEKDAGPIWRRMAPNGMMSALQESGLSPKRKNCLPSMSICGERALLTSGRLLPPSSISPQMLAWHG
jgi:hypothetical protein